MLEKNYAGNIFLLPRQGEAAAVTTNGVIRNNGAAAMGAGIAKYVRDHFPGADMALGASLRQYGNHACYLGCRGWAGMPPEGAQAAIHILAFPTKRHWKDASSPALIRQSATEIMQLADVLGFTRVYLPKPGCGLGGLCYETQVRPILTAILDDRFTVCIG